MKTGKLNFFIILLAATFLSGCKEAEMYSQWTEPVTLNENSNIDWPAEPQHFDEASKTLVFLMNDDTFLYIRLLSRSPKSKMMFLRGGFTVWIDDTGGTEKHFGLQFPLPQKRQLPGNRSEHRPRNSMEEMLKVSQYNLAILSETEETRQTMPTTKAAEMGIYAQLKIQQGYLFYELKVPLSNSKENRIIGVGFETGPVEMASNGGRRGGKGGGRGGSGGKGGQKMGGNRAAHGGSRPQPIDIWATVYLAENVSMKDRENTAKNKSTLK